MKKKSLEKAYWALAAISFFWGTTWFVSKLAIQEIPPLQLTGMRQITAGFILIIYFFFKYRKLPQPKTLLFHLLIGFLLITCSNGLTTYAIRFIPSFLGALIGCLMPFVMILANFLLFKEKVNSKVIVALVIGFSGVAILLSSFKTEMAGAHFLFGIILTLVSVGTWTSGTLITTKSKYNQNAFEGIGWQMFFGGIMLLISSRLVKGEQVTLANISFNGWLYFIYLVGVGSIFCFMCYLYALKKLSISLVSIYVYINPIVALLLGVLLLNEKISLQLVVGVLITFIGIYLVKLFSKKKEVPEAI